MNKKHQTFAEWQNDPNNFQTAIHNLYAASQKIPISNAGSRAEVWEMLKSLSASKRIAVDNQKNCDLSFDKWMKDTGGNNKYD